MMNLAAWFCFTVISVINLLLVYDPLTQFSLNIGFSSSFDGHRFISSLNSTLDEIIRLQFQINIVMISYLFMVFVFT